MLSKENTGRAYAILLASMWAFVITLLTCVWFDLNAVWSLLLFLILWIGIYITGLWTFICRPTELNKKFPITGQEFRKRREEFYAFLNSPRKPRR
jgi:hypothetical protein